MNQYSVTVIVTVMSHYGIVAIHKYFGHNLDLCVNEFAANIVIITCHGMQRYHSAT